METMELSEEVLEGFREVGNIGSGCAAARLSHLINRPCVIDLPQVGRMAHVAPDKLVSEDCVAVTLHVKIMGDIPSLMCVVAEKQHAHTVVDYITKLSPSDPSLDFSFTSQFALKQMGEVLTKAFSDSVSKFLMTSTKYAMPQIIIDKWSTALSSLLRYMADANGENLVIHSSFFDTEKTFQGRFIYILGPESQALIQDKLQSLMQG